MKYLYVIMLILNNIQTKAQESLTWNRDISCIFYSHCTNCHNSKGLAFDLTTYDKVNIWKNRIKETVSNKTMPPWPPNPLYKNLAHERNLTNIEIESIIQWINNGLPEGNEPQIAVPISVTSNQILNPDLLLKMPKYQVPKIEDDLYRCFIVSEKITNQAFIKSIEVIPGNRNIVHHVLIYEDTSDEPLRLDAIDTLPGYTNFGGIGSNTAKLIGGWVPGSSSYSTPIGMGIQIDMGARIIIQVHYPKEGSQQYDSTKVNIKFSTESNIRNITIQPILNHITNINPSLTIEPNTVKTFYEKQTIPTFLGDITFVSIAPHAHLLCKSMRAYAITPKKDTIRFIDIPNWDFHWQGFYDFKKPVVVPAGSTLYGEATYDNTIHNHHNPSNPPRLVNVGESTTDEMMVFFFAATPYKTGDENITIDENTHLPHYQNCSYNQPVITSNNKYLTHHLFKIYPNPTHEFLHYETKQKNIDINLYNNAGNKILEMKNAPSFTKIPLANLPSGLYIFEAVKENIILEKTTFVIE
ncbi:MAG: T9SS type A sorting domain-containing protein [Chitinophagaceae bacterium]|nr:T9SS type A sorting domain-containing protein [Chitinophagaceae bacterium]